MSYASNLKGGASIDITIPDHLKIVAQKLEHRGFKLRQMSKINAAGDPDKLVKTQVRYDNDREGLVLGVRSSKDASWQFFPPGKLPPLGQTAAELESSDTNEDEDLPSADDE